MGLGIGQLARNLGWMGIVALVLGAGACHADVYVDATQAPTAEVSAAYFGTHMHRLVLHPNERAVPTQWPTIAFGGMRLWDTGTRWADLAPQAGVWEYARMDHYVNTSYQNGAEVLYTLGSTPQWASARADEWCPYGRGCAAEPVRLAHWEEYVRRVAQRYGKRIAAYELWNEPNFSNFKRDVGAPGFYTGSVEHMVEMARVARKTLDTVAPQAKLCTPGFVNGPDRLELFLSSGGAQYVQAVCYHFYSEGSDHFATQVVEVRNIMKRNGVADLPLWNTEAGVDSLGVGDPPNNIGAKTRQQAVARLSQMLILGAASGMERFYYYAWDNTHSGMVAPNGQKLFGYAELDTLQQWLLGTKFLGCKSAASVVTCTGMQNQKRFFFAWTTQGAAKELVLPAGEIAQQVDRLFGEPSAPHSAAADHSNVRVDGVPARISLQSNP